MSVLALVALLSARPGTVSRWRASIPVTQFVRCSRPRATLHMAGDNVAHGRGQRCTRPCATHHQAFRDAKARFGKDFRPFPHKCIAQKNTETRTESISCLAYSRGHRRIVPRSRACLQHRRPCKPGAGMGGGYEEENACVRYLFLSNTEYVFHLGQFVSTKCWGLGSGQTLAKLLGAAGAHND